MLSSKGTTAEQTTSNANVLQLYSQLSTLLLKKDELAEQSKTPRKCKNRNHKSLSKSNINLNATQFSEKQQQLLSPTTAMIDFKATFNSLSPTNTVTSKGKLKKSEFHHTIGKSSS